MPIIERDIVLTGKEDGNHTIDLPITALKNVEDTAEVKEKPVVGDYIPLMDSADNGQMKKVLVSALKELLGITVDDALSETSDNPIKNKAVQAAVKTLTESVQNAAAAGNNAMPKSGGSFTGAAYAHNDAEYTAYKLRNTAVLNAVPSGMTDGTIALVYA